MKKLIKQFLYKQCENEVNYNVKNNENKGEII